MHQVNIYKKLPVSIQNVACSAYGFCERRIRMSRYFWDKYQSLLESEESSKFKIKAYQDEQTAALIEHVYRTVPYYRRVMADYGLKPVDITCVEDLVKFPILRKEDIIQNFDSFFSKKFPKTKLRISKTSGTSGKALKFCTTHEAIAFQWAIWWRHRSRFGIKPFELHLNFTGKPIVPITQKNPPYWRWNWPMRQALVNMQHLTPEKILSIASFAGKTNFAYYSGYPSIVYQFSNLIRERELKLSYKPNFIFLGAENIYDFQHTVIEEVTGAKITDQYGLSEGCGNASRCEYNIYHEDWEFGFLEYINSEELPDGNIKGKIIATGFANYGFPFIRYSVGDTAIWTPTNYKCTCGRNSRTLLKIEGRNEDYVLTPEGARIMRFDYIFKETKGIKEAQVIQREPNAIIVRIVPRDSYSYYDETLIRDMIREWISPKLKVYLELVKLIPRSNSGKFRQVISELTEGATD